MTRQRPPEGAPVAAPSKANGKRKKARAIGSETPIELRSGNTQIDEVLVSWVQERIGRELGKFASQIERVTVRFQDENGPKGGIDRSCSIQVSLRTLPHVIVNQHGQSNREAFDRAAARAERATRRSLERHGFHINDFEGQEAEQPQAAQASVEPARAASAPLTPAADSIIGRRAGHGRKNLQRAAERPEKVRRDQPVDTSQSGVSASDRRAGYGHTAKRNTKLNTAGMSYALEDSTTGRPSRMSTRRASNRVKPDNPLTRRTKSKVQSAGAKASRARARAH